MTQFVSILCLEILMTAGMTAHAWPCLAQVSREDVHKDFQVVRMTVDPANEPIPAFRYRMLPHERDQERGNAVPFYLRAMLELEEIERQIEEEFGEDYYDWATADNDKVPVDSLRNTVRQFDEAVMPHLSVAVRRTDADWGYEERALRGPEVYAFPLPEMQPARSIARMLGLRARLAILEGRHDDAIESLTIGYKLARDVSTSRFFVTDLVGIASASIINRQTEELIAAEGSPNLYWALQALPDPLVITRDSVEFELNMAERVFPWMHDVEIAEHTPDEWRRIFTDSLDLLLQMGAREPVEEPTAEQRSQPDRLGQVRRHGMAVFVALKAYPKSKEALVAGGMNRDEVEAMPVPKVLLLQNARAYRFLTDRLEMAWHVPFWQSHRLAAEAESFEELGLFEGGPEHRALEPIPIGRLLLPAINAFRRGQERHRRDHAALKVIEAIRMHAATEGELPGSLDEISAVPVPFNPATGQPFDYELRGDTAMLTLPMEHGLQPARRYEIRLRE